MYTPRLLSAFEGYRRIAWLILGAVTIWRAGYFYKGDKEVFFAWYNWLEWQRRWLNKYDEILLYVIITLIEIAVVMVILVAVIECVTWVHDGFNPEFHKRLPEPTAEFKAKFLKIGSRIIGWLPVGPVGFVFVALLIDIDRRGQLRLSDRAWLFIAGLVLISIICWITARLMSRKARELNEKRP